MTIKLIYDLIEVLTFTLFEPMQADCWCHDLLPEEECNRCKVYYLIDQLTELEYDE
jgi:hypothetical protein